MNLEITQNNVLEIEFPKIIFRNNLKNKNPRKSTYEIRIVRNNYLFF